MFHLFYLNSNNSKADWHSKAALALLSVILAAELLLSLRSRWRCDNIYLHSRGSERQYTLEVGHGTAALTLRTNSAMALMRSAVEYRGGSFGNLDAERSYCYYPNVFCQALGISHFQVKVVIGGQSETSIWCLSLAYMMMWTTLVFAGLVLHRVFLRARRGPQCIGKRLN